MRMQRTMLAAAVAAVTLAPAAQAAEQVKLGLMLALSGPLAIVGGEMQRGADLALATLGSKLGGVPVTVIPGDDKAQPSEGVQVASKMIDQDKVDIVTGLTSSNVLIAVAPSFADAKITMVGGLAGASEFAGKGCNPYLFISTFENEDWDMVMGNYMNRKGYKNVFFIGQDYQAGWEQIGGARKTYTGKVAGQVFTPLAQLDFAAELAQIRAANPDAVFGFMVGQGGIAFVKQYAQAGLQKIPFLGTDAMATPLQWPALGDAALGMTVGTNWSYDLDNPENKAFVAAFRDKYKRQPSIFAALQYDAIMLIDGAVRDVHGKIEDKDALHAALRKADFKSIRGPFKFDNNQYPIDNIYIEQVQKDAQGQLTLKLLETGATAWRDLYHDQCPMKW
ncbi:MAG TPA: ABC transporter substrate-binding protein [Stellaceae bacterium]|nr:ABC transporter substrate-binding protein [Stellaceae bacterium]